MKYKLMILVTVLSISIIGIGGCESPQPVNPEAVSPTPTDDVGSAVIIQGTPKTSTDPTEDNTGLAIRDDSLITELDPAETGQAFAFYHLDDVQMVIVGEQAVDEFDLTDEVTQRLREHFTEMGIRLQNVGNSKLSSHDPDTIRRFSTAHDADLATVITGEATERAKLGRMLSYEAKIRATIYESDGNIVVTKEITKVGSRSSNSDRAASSALRAAAAEIGPFLSEQLLRKLGQNVMTRRLVITDLKYYGSVTKIMKWLKQQDGINDVRLISWDEDSGTARFTIYLQPAAKDNLGIYVTNTPHLEIRILHIDKAGATGHERRP